MDGDTTRERATGPGTGTGGTGWAIALAFVLVGLVTLGDRGLTWDEPESLLAGVGNLEVLRTVAAGSTEVDWPWHELKGHQFVIDTARVVVARVAGPLVGGPEIDSVPIRGFHLVHLLLTAAALLLVHRLAAELSGSAWVAALAALLLATLPKLVAHSQNNPKDLVALFVYALFLWALERAIRSGRTAAYAGAGAVLGFAFTSHVLSALLVPIGGAWLLYRRGLGRTGRWRDRWRELVRIAAVLGASAGATTFALWPWLWADPVIRTARVVRRVVAFPLEMEVLHLGRLYPAAELPREYFLVHLAASTPLFVLATAVAGAAVALRRRPRPGEGPRRPERGRPPVAGRGDDAGRHRLAVLALLWLGVPVAVEAFTSARYDGVRHLLCVLPALAILAALGLDALGRWAAAGQDRSRDRSPVRSRTRAVARALLALVALSWLWTLVDLVRYHPYQDAYLNAATRRAIEGSGREPQELFELEYWGSAYREGAEWLRERARESGEEPTVFVPFGAWCAAPYAGPRVTVTGDLWLDGRAGDLGVVDADAPDPGSALGSALGSAPGSAPEPDFLMILPRRSFFTPPIERIRRGREPVFTVERLGATLLEIYDVGVDAPLR